MSETFNINPTRGAEVVYLKSSDKLKEIKWNTGSIKLRDMLQTKRYNIIYTKINNEIYMRPTQPYMDACFEGLFGFNNLCENYSDEKTIKIKFN
jgi:hypothetical protein